MATGQDVVDEVRAAINDEDSDGYRWSDAELLRYINAAQRQIAVIVPEANILETVEQVSIGTQQAIPAVGIKFLGVWNYDTGNEVRGPAITQVELDALNSSFQEWSIGTFKGDYYDYPSSADEHSAEFFENFAHDPRDPKHYFLSPAPTTADGSVLVKYSAVPTSLETLEDELDLTDEYFDAIVDYVVYRALRREGRYKSPSEQQEMWDHFLRSLGFYIDSSKRVDPATNRPPSDAHG